MKKIMFCIFLYSFSCSPNSDVQSQNNSVSNLVQSQSETVSNNEIFMQKSKTKCGDGDSKEIDIFALPEAKTTNKKFDGYISNVKSLVIIDEHLNKAQRDLSNYKITLRESHRILYIFLSSKSRPKDMKEGGGVTSTTKDMYYSFCKEDRKQIGRYFFR